MITSFDEKRLAAPAGGSVISIGVFDGVHLGHEAILAANLARATELGAVPTVITFRRHPKKVILGHSPRTLTTLDHRLSLFRQAGIRHAVALKFDERLRSMAAEDFCTSILVNRLDVRHLVLGFDSKFGRDRSGTPEYLRELGYSVDVVPKVLLGDRAVSSTAIREAVELGDLAGAAAMLGRPHSVFGLVIRGDSLGRTIGFPTANLDLHAQLHPPEGVYACRVYRVGLEGDGAREHSFHGVCNIGYRPTVTDERPDKPRVEVHLFDFEGNLYGTRLEVEFGPRLRGERRFDGLDALKAQIAADEAAARAALAAGSPWNSPAPNPAVQSPADC